MKKIELQEWALAAEIIGGLAVVVTLIFLVSETRDNTNAIQAQTYQSLTAALNENRKEAATSEMSVIIRKFSDTGLASLSQDESFRLMMNTEGKWGIYESAFYARERGVLGQDEWVRFHNAICRNLDLDKSLWDPQSLGLSLTLGSREVSIATNVTPKFRAYVNSSCE